MMGPTFFALVLVELGSVVLFGIALAALPGWRLRRVASLFPAGLLALGAEALLLSAFPQRGVQVAVLVSTRVLASTVVYRHRARARDFLTDVRGLALPAATALVTVSLGALLLASDYRQGSYLDADALAFWSLRGHFLFASETVPGAFWGGLHPDYPILLPLLDAHGFFLAGDSGEVATAAVGYVLALVALLVLADALRSVVSPVACFALPVLFLLAPVPIFPVHWRILLAGYAETWSILFVALLCRWTPRDRERPVSWDDGLVLLSISLLKNEGTLFALVYLVVRSGSIGLARGLSPELKTMLRRGVALSAPCLVWAFAARVLANQSHYDFFALPTLDETREGVQTLVAYYRALPWTYGLVPVVLVTSLLWPGSDPRARLFAPDLRDAWLAAHAALLYGLLVSIVLFFKGPPLVVLENSFHRLHWPILLLALIAATRMAGGRRDAAASPPAHTEEGAAS